MSGDGTLLNDVGFMMMVLENVKELKDYDFPPDHHFYRGDMTKIDGVLHMWDGEKWANQDTIYKIQETP